MVKLSEPSAFPQGKEFLGENISSERHYPYGILTGTTPSSGKVN